MNWEKLPRKWKFERRRAWEESEGERRFNTVSALVICFFYLSRQADSLIDQRWFWIGTRGWWLSLSDTCERERERHIDLDGAISCFFSYQPLLETTKEEGKLRQRLFEGKSVGKWRIVLLIDCLFPQKFLPILWIYFVNYFFYLMYIKSYNTFFIKFFVIVYFILIFYNNSFFLFYFFRKCLK